MPIDYAPSYVTILGMVRAAGPLMPEPDEDTSSPDVDNPLKDLCQCVIYTRLSREDDKSHSPETAEGWMTFVDLLKFAEWERKMIVKRTRDGLATAHRKGIHLGTMPRHFTKDDGGRIMPTSQAMEVVKLRSEGKSYTQIARRVGNVTRQEAFSICKYLVNELARGALN